MLELDRWWMDGWTDGWASKYETTCVGLRERRVSVWGQEVATREHEEGGCGMRVAQADEGHEGKGN